MRIHPSFSTVPLHYQLAPNDLIADREAMEKGMGSGGTGKRPTWRTQPRP